MVMSLPAFISNDLVGDSSLLNKLNRIRAYGLDSNWPLSKTLKDYEVNSHRVHRFEMLRT